MSAAIGGGVIIRNSRARLDEDEDRPTVRALVNRSRSDAPTQRHA